MQNPHGNRERGQDSTDTILLSGGIDSATALALAVNTKRSLSALFIDYGQPAAARESAASVAVATHYQVPHRSLRAGSLAFGSGEIRGRNAFLVHLAMLAAPAKSGALILAIHAGTPYRDCSLEFAKLMQQSLDFHTSGELVVAVPFVAMTKSEVYQVASRLEVPIQLTYSCEAGISPCGVCLSCMDREALLAST